MKKKDMYTLQELYDELEIPLSALGRKGNMSEGTVSRIRDGYPARRSTLNKLLRAFSEVYGIELSFSNVSGIQIEDKREAKNPARIDEKLSTSTSTTDASQPENTQIHTVEPSEGAIRLSDFAKSSGIPLRTLHNWREAGKIEATQVDRLHSGGIEYFLTPEQQEKAKMIDSLRTPRKKK